MTESHNKRQNAALEHRHEELYQNSEMCKMNAASTVGCNVSSTTYSAACPRCDLEDDGRCDYMHKYQCLGTARPFVRLFIRQYVDLPKRSPALPSEKTNADFIPRETFFYRGRCNIFLPHMRTTWMRMRDEINAGNFQMQLEIRDARLPLSSRNPYFQNHDSIPKVIVYNKSDLTCDAEGDHVRELKFYQVLC